MSHDPSSANQRLSYPDRPPRRMFQARYVDVPVETVAAGREKVVEFLENAAGKGFVVDSLEQQRTIYADKLDVAYRVTYIKYTYPSRRSYRSRRMAQYR